MTNNTPPLLQVLNLVQREYLSRCSTIEGMQVHLAMITRMRIWTLVFQELRKYYPVDGLEQNYNYAHSRRQIKTHKHPSKLKSKSQTYHTKQQLKSCNSPKDDPQVSYQNLAQNLVSLYWNVMV